MTAQKLRADRLAITVDEDQVLPTRTCRPGVARAHTARVCWQGDHPQQRRITAAKRRGRVVARAIVNRNDFEGFANRQRLRLKRRNQLESRFGVPVNWDDDTDHVFGSSGIRSTQLGCSSAMKILFVLPRMVSGGVERVTLNLIAEFQKSGHECCLALRRARGEYLPEARALTRVHEVAPAGMYQFVPRLARLIRVWQPTHVVTAFTDIGVLTWLAMRLVGNSARWVHGVHNVNARATARSGLRGALRFRLDNLAAAFVYRCADKVIAVSEGVREDILDQFRVEPTRVVMIYNPVVPAHELIPIHELRHPLGQPFTIAAMGRLTREKGFDTLIDAMREVPPPWRLDIWGDGEDRSLLERQIKEAGLGAAVHLRGYTDNPYMVLRAADLFVLSSRWEGFGNVLVEALACRCQVVAVDCPHGPREILRGGLYGRLVAVGDIQGLMHAIQDARNGSLSPVEPAALADWLRRFTNEESGDAWRKVLNDL